MVKATPAPSLVVAQAEFLFKLLIVSFNAPAHFGGLDQLHKRGMNGQGRQPILGRFGLIFWPFDQQPLFFAWSAKPLFITMRRPHPQGGKARRQFLVAPLTPVNRAPSVWGQRFSQSLHTERCTARHTLPACRRPPDFVFGLGRQRPRAGYPHRGDRLHSHTVLQLHPSSASRHAVSLPYPASASTMPMGTPAALAARICSSAIWGLV